MVQNQGGSFGILHKQTKKKQENYRRSIRMPRGKSQKSRLKDQTAATKFVISNGVHGNLHEAGLGYKK